MMERRRRAAMKSNSQDLMPLQLLFTKPVVAYPDEPLRAVVYRMAETGFTRLPVD